MTINFLIINASFVLSVSRLLSSEKSCLKILTEDIFHASMKKKDCSQYNSSNFGLIGGSLCRVHYYNYKL